MSERITEEPPGAFAVVCEDLIRMHSIVAVLIVSGSIAAAAPAGAAEKPNVVVFVLDSARADHLGCYGYDRDTTPNIDRFAAAGTIYTNVFAEGSYTFVSTVALMTGLTPATTGLVEPEPLPARYRVLAERANDAGYRSYGYSENPYVTEAFGLARGFSRFEEAFPYPVGSESVESVDFPVFRSEEQIRSALDWISTKSPKPFFLYFHILRPHNPYQAPPPFKGRFAAAAKGAIDGSTQTLLDIESRHRVLTQLELDRIVALYDENLAYGDHLFGLLLRGLETRGLDDETVIAVLSDHGEAFGEHGHMLHNSTVFDEMIRVPVIVRQPGRAGGVRNDELMQLRDIGQSIANLFSGNAGNQGGGASRAATDASASEPGTNPGRRDHLAFTWSYAEPGLVAVRSLSHKLILAVESGEVIARPLQFYDLRSDPAERRPLSVEGNSTAKMLMDRYLELTSKTSTPENKGLQEMNAELEEQLRALGYVE